MADPKLDFDPILGWEDTTETVFKTNPDDIEVRPMFQRLHSQIRDFINNTLIAWIKANYTMAIDVLTRTNTDVFTPTAQYHPATKKYVDDTSASVVLGQIPDGSLTDVKLSYEAGQIKDVVTTHLADTVKHITEEERTIWDGKQTTIKIKTGSDFTTADLANGEIGIVY